MKSIKNDIDNNWYRYIFFAILRIFLVFVPQVGYIHPDEFFQTMEIVNGDHFKLEHIRSWEFNNTLPIRSIILPFLFLRIPWSFMEFAAIYFKQYLSIDILCGYTYLVFPRLIYCAISFINDWSIYQVCRLYNLKYEIRLLALGSCWILLIFGTRTFSNSLEMTFSSLLLYFVAECMITTNTTVYKKEFLDKKYDEAVSIGERVKIWKLKNSLPAHNYKRLLFISSLCVAGIFNRPTFLIFAAPMVFFWLFRGLGSKTITFIDFHLRMLLFCLSCLPALILFIVFDSIYYEYLTIEEIQTLNIHIENFIITPLNFIIYNLNPHNTAAHGKHPLYYHILINIPFLYGILGLIALISFSQMLYKFSRAEYQYLPRVQSLISLLTATIFIPLFLLSFINHQEARFLIPLTLPIIILHAPKLITGFHIQYTFNNNNNKQSLSYHRFYKQLFSKNINAKTILNIWFISNILLTVFFGFIHQAGVIPLAQYFERVMISKNSNEEFHLLTSHIYMLPLSLVNLPNSELIHFDRITYKRFKRSKDFHLHEFGSLNMKQLLNKMKLIISQSNLRQKTKNIKQNIYLAIPTSLSHEFNSNIWNMLQCNYNIEHIFYPHLSTEALPKFFGKHPCNIDNFHNNDEIEIEKIPTFNYSNIVKQFSSFIHQFSLGLYKIHCNNRNFTSDTQNLISNKITNKEKCYI